MKTSVYLFLAFFGGMCLAIQGALNAQLGVYLRNPVMASLVAFIFSSVFAFAYIITVSKDATLLIKNLQLTPKHLWFAGALFSVIGISLYYYTIPKIGVATMISFGLSGQLFCAMLAAHYGWFGLAVEPITIKKITGFLSMILAIYLINSKT